jgi:hypothetical protein
MDDATVGRFVDAVPSEWDVDRETRAALRAMVVRRASFVADNILRVLEREYPIQLSANMGAD